MRFFDMIRIPFRNLFRRKLRTILTIVSMMVGAFLISIMMSVGNGLEDFLVSQVTMFSNRRTLSVRKDIQGPGFFAIGGGVEEYEEDAEDEDDSAAVEGTDSGSEQEKIIEESQLDREDIEKIEDIENVEVAEFQKFVTPRYMQLAQDDNENDSKKIQVNLIGLPLQLRKSVNFAAYDEDLIAEENSVIISDSYAEQWGVEREDLLGRKVLINVQQELQLADINQDGNSSQESLPNQLPPDQAEPSAPTGLENSPEPENSPKPENKNFEFIVAGVMEKSLLSSMALISNDKVSEISAYKFNQSEEEFEKDDSAFEMIVVVDSAENAKKVDEEIEELGYESDTYDESIGQIGSVFDIINYLLSSFGAIALVVASIGIVNTLLMAIYERTREIGVMKAVGATRRQIWSMFTMEATLLGFFGGLVGLGFGYGFGRLADYILHNGLKIRSFTIIKAFLEDYPGFNVSVFSADIIILVMGVTTGVAFLAGLYPAWRASKLNPIKALRTE